MKANAAMGGRNKGQAAAGLAMGYFSLTLSAFPGNGMPGSHENSSVEALDEELFQVAKSLCEIAAAFFLLGDPVTAETNIEQAAELLAERGRQRRFRPAHAEVLQ
jgi:hypothetical protein